MLTMSEVKIQAKEKMTLCRMCRFCNGEACRGETPGCGGKGSGSTFVRNVAKLKDVRVCMDVLHEDYEIDTKIAMFGKDMAAPLFCAPIAGAVVNYGSKIEEEEYVEAIISGARAAGIYAFLGDGAMERIFQIPCDALHRHNGEGIMTIKPWAEEIAYSRLARIMETKPFAIAMDVDASGLVHLKQSPTPITFKTTADLRALKEKMGCHFIVKGIMTVEGAQKAMDAHADAIVVSNHGGRVLDDAEATIEVLEEIAGYIGGRMKILIDGGFRSGADIFKALALGADGVLIGRPFSHAAIGGGADGVKLYSETIIAELKEVMRLSNCQTIADIKRHKVKVI